MIEIKHKKLTLELYNDIDQLPIVRFNKANKFWMLHDNIGSSIEDIDRNHLSKLALIAGDEAKCKKEIANLRILIYNIITEVNVNHMSFACLISKVNGKPANDLSDDGIKKLLKKLSDGGLTNEVLKKKLQNSGRKSTKSWRFISLRSLRMYLVRFFGLNRKRKQ